MKGHEKWMAWLARWRSRRWRPRLKVGQWLMLSHGCVIGLLVLLTVVGIRNLQVLSDTTDQALLEQYPKIMMVNQLGNDLGIIARAMRNVLILKDPEHMHLQLTDINRSRDRMVLTLARLKQQMKGSAGRKILDEISIVHSAYMVNQDEFTNLVTQNRLGEARNLLVVDIYGYQNNYFALLDELGKYQAALMQQSSMQVGNTNRQARSTMLLLALFAATLALSISWLFTRSLLRQLGGEPGYAAAIAHKIAIGDLVAPIELNPNDHYSLLFSMRAMRDSLIERTTALQNTNRELANTIETLNRAQEELVTSEKLAALGALVAGIAHELNTPIGNGMMAASTIADLTRKFELDCQQGVKKSALADYLHNMGKGGGILIANLTRAGNLIASFKQVAVDRTTSRGRRFKLHEVVGEILLTLQPQLKKTMYMVEQDIAPGIVMDSYPGPLGQVLTNLISNALIHGFDERPVGTVSITARDSDGDHVELSVQDDGKGIAPDNIRHIYDPFFTTKLGEGGSGLGLHITHNIVTGILQGKIRVTSQLGRGTVFVLTLPKKVLEL